MSEKMLTIAKYRCRVIVNDVSGIPLVFFHGLSYTSEVWRRLSITGLLIEKHIPFLALNMPYGAKSDCRPRTRDVGTNIAFANEVIRNFFSDTIPVLVGASLGAHMALNYATQFSVKGLLLVAPVRSLELRLLQAYDRFNFPVRIVVGSEDRIVSIEELRDLVGKLPNAKFIEYEGAKHSAYIDFPDRFKHDLMEVYAAVE
ncbi:MAG: alpha/beta fold hydrolase [Chloroflexota bacterium]